MRSTPSTLMSESSELYLIEEIAVLGLHRSNMFFFRISRVILMHSWHEQSCGSGDKTILRVRGFNHFWWHRETLMYRTFAVWRAISMNNFCVTCSPSQSFIQSKTLMYLVNMDGPWTSSAFSEIDWTHPWHDESFNYGYRVTLSIRDMDVNGDIVERLCMVHEYLERVSV